MARGSKTKFGLEPVITRELNPVQVPSGTSGQMPRVQQGDINKSIVSKETGIGVGDAVIRQDTSKGFWIGDSVFLSAPFRVDMNGNLVASSATITGAITATSGSIGGFTVGADYIRDAANSFGLASTVTGGDDVRFWAGGTFANRSTAYFRVTEAGQVYIDYGADLNLVSGGDIKFTSVSAPGALTATLVATGTGNVTIGDHLYRVTFVNASGETEAGTASNTVTTDASHKQVDLTNIPVSSSGSVTARKIYRTTIGDVSAIYLLTTINDNTTTTYTDNTSDASLTGYDAQFRENNTFGKVYVDTIKSIELSSNNVFVGQLSGASVGVSFRNVGIGYKSLNALTAGYENVAVGDRTLQFNTQGYRNVALGAYALTNNTTGYNNVVIGYNALSLASNTGQGSVAIGPSAMYSSSSGDNNVAVGNSVLYTNTTGDDNTGVGDRALYSNSTGALNTAVGKFALYTSTGSNNIAIGYSAGRYATSSNEFYVDNTDRTNSAGDKANAILYGVMSGSGAASQKLTINGLLNQSVSKTPASATDTGTTGDIAWDTNYIYVCTATNTWKRVAIATW